MPSPFTPLKTSPSANKNNSSGDSCQRFCNVLCETKCPESSNKCCAQRQAKDSSKKWLSCCCCTENLIALRRKTQTALTTKMKVWSEECAAPCQLSMGCGAGQDDSSAPGGWRKHKAPGTLIFCLSNLPGKHLRRCE